MEESRGAKRVLVEGPDGKRPLGRPRHSWENNKMDLQDVEEAWSGLLWLRIGTGGSCECSNEPPSFIKCRKFLHQLRNC